MKRPFDCYAEDYDRLLNDAISISGETKNYFARARLAILGGLLKHFDISVETVLDFGCGTGSTTPHFFEYLGVKKVLGVDPSDRMIDLARQGYSSEHARFVPLDQYAPGKDVDLVFCNGVLHHLSLTERTDALQLIKDSLRPRGLFSLWENNPWNPGTVYIMKRCIFDQNAQMLSLPIAKRMINRAEFQILKAGYHFIFPRTLSALRIMEPLVASFPLGAQYHILAR